jgi:hypothetical protein
VESARSTAGAGKAEDVHTEAEVAHGEATAVAVGSHCTPDKAAAEAGQEPASGCLEKTTHCRASEGTQLVVACEASLHIAAGPVKVGQKGQVESFVDCWCHKQVVVMVVMEDFVHMKTVGRLSVSAENLVAELARSLLEQRSEPLLLPVPEVTMEMMVCWAEVEAETSWRYSHQHSAQQQRLFLRDRH